MFSTHKPPPSHQGLLAFINCLFGFTEWLPRNLEEAVASWKRGSALLPPGLTSSHHYIVPSCLYISKSPGTVFMVVAVKALSVSRCPLLSWRERAVATSPVAQAGRGHCAVPHPRVLPGPLRSLPHYVLRLFLRAVKLPCLRSGLIINIVMFSLEIK